MQISKDKLMAQQLVMFHLGFYKGQIDGIWSTASIEAKRKFEVDDLFLPAYPNGGLPFGERDKLPKGMKYVEGNVITHETLTKERAAEIMAAKGTSKAQPQKEVLVSDQAEVVSVEEPVHTPQVEVKEPVQESSDVEKAAKDERNNQNHKRDHQHKDRKYDRR